MSGAMLGFYLLAAGAGVSFVVQQVVNANLRLEIGSAAWAGFVSYLGGTVAMLLLALALREPLSLAAAGRSSWLSWTGGVFGAVYIGVSILLLPRLGAATLIALIVAGQMLGSLAFDHFGVLGVTQHAVTLPRLLGTALLIAGVVLIRL
jgi:bacterial/archaeal transporter family-2 protein